MKRRSTEIIQKIIHNYNQTTTVMTLAKEFNVSTKTLRNDLKEINQFLKLNNTPPIEISKDGMFIINPELDAQSIMNKLYEMDIYEYKLSPLERQIYIQIKLIMSSNYSTMKSFADELYVTRITIINDIDIIKNSLKDFKVELILDSGKGMLLSGNYEDKLELLIELYKKITINVEGTGIFQRIIFNNMKIHYSFSDIFMYMQEYVKVNNLVFIETVFYDIVLYLFIIFNFPDYSSKMCNNKLKENISYSEIDYMIIYAGKKLDIEITQEMFDRFQAYIKKHDLFSFVKSVDEVELCKVITHFISEIETAFHMSLIQDNTLLNSLIMHIKRMRDWGNYEIELPNKDDNAIDYLMLQELVNKNSYILEHFLGYKLSDNMKNSIIIHICVAIIRNRKFSTRLSVAIICPGSMATGKYLEAQIKNYFDFDIVGVYTVKEVSSILANEHKQVDFIFSTVNIQIKGYNVIKVRPCLSMDDLNYIQKVTFQNQKIDGLSFINKKEKINNYISELIDDENLKKQLCDTVNEILYNYEKLNMKIKENPISELLKKEFILLFNEKLEWFDAMRMAANPLIANGYIEERYIEQAILHVKEYGNYFIVSPGVALAHASKGFGVIKDGLSLLVSKEGINFPDNNTVNLLFCFSSNGDKDYLELLRSIISLGKTPDKVNSIIQLKTKDEIFKNLEVVDTFI